MMAASVTPAKRERAGEGALVVPAVLLFRDRITSVAEERRGEAREWREVREDRWRRGGERGGGAGVSGRSVIQAVMRLVVGETGRGGGEGGGATGGGGATTGGGETAGGSTGGEGKEPGTRVGWSLSSDDSTDSGVVGRGGGSALYCGG